MLFRSFDADLYSSTICALRHSKNIIDEKTVLIFDEFIMTDHWEDDEYRALNNFCDEFSLSYEVLAVSSQFASHHWIHANESEVAHRFHFCHYRRTKTVNAQSGTSP